MIFLSAHRKGYLENSTGVPVVGADRSLMQVDDLLGQGKADAGFSAFSHVEAVKDVRQIISFLSPDTFYSMRIYKPMLWLSY